MTTPVGGPSVQNNQVAVGNLAMAGSSPFLDKGNIIPISDNDDPIQFMETRIRSAAGVAAGTISDVKIKGHNVVEDPDIKDSPVKIYTFRNPPGPLCYYFVHIWEVTIPGSPEKKLTFSKNIYTNIRVPDAYEGATHAERQRLAGVVCKVYANIVREAVVNKLEPGIGGKFLNEVKDQITKIQRDRFVTMVMKDSEGREINPLRPLNRHVVSYVDLHFRRGNTELEGDKKEAAKEEHRRISLLSQKQNKLSLGKRLAGQSYQLQYSDDSPVYIKEVARFQSIERFRNLILEGQERNVPIDDILKEQGVTKEAYWDYLEGVGTDKQGISVKLRNDFKSHSDYFTNPKLFANVVNSYGIPSKVTVNVKNLFNPKHDIYIATVTKGNLGSNPTPLQLLGHAYDNKFITQQDYQETIEWYNSAFKAMEKMNSELWLNDQSMYQLYNLDQTKITQEAINSRNQRVAEIGQELKTAFGLTPRPLPPSPQATPSPAQGAPLPLQGTPSQVQGAPLPAQGTPPPAQGTPLPVQGTPLPSGNPTTSTRNRTLDENG